MAQLGGRWPSKGKGPANAPAASLTFECQPAAITSHYAMTIYIKFTFLSQSANITEQQPVSSSNNGSSSLRRVAIWLQLGVAGKRVA
jgi:hypothetical protein